MIFRNLIVIQYLLGDNFLLGVAIINNSLKGFRLIFCKSITRICFSSEFFLNWS